MSGIYWGSTEIPDGKLNWGSTAVTEVFWGATKIWPPVPFVNPQGPRWAEDNTPRVTEDDQPRITEGAS